MHHVGFAQLAFPLGAFLRQYMAPVRLVTFEATRGRALKALCGAPVRFDFRHFPKIPSIELLVFLGREHHDHLPTLHFRKLLNNRQFFKILFDPFQEIHT